MGATVAKKVDATQMTSFKLCLAALMTFLILPHLAVANPQQKAMAAIFEEANAECRSQVPKIDEDPTLAEVTLDDSSIFKMQIAADGKMATVLYNEFLCSLGGYGWCGSGGCGFNIIVDGVRFERGGGFTPFSITQDGKTYVMIPLHGSGCVDAEGISGAGPHDCMAVATWDDDAKTFRSKGGELKVRN